MRAKETLLILGVTRVTLMNYVKRGIIKVTKLHNGYYDYDDKSVYDFIGHNQRINVLYSRVSTQKQSSDLDRQLNSLLFYSSSHNIKIDKTFSEISSGIDLNRPKFTELLNDIFHHKINNVIITHKDRLTRLSFVTLENIFKQFGTSIIVINEHEDKTMDQEIFDELISIMHYFSTKIYSNRKNK